ncbi:MAG: PQQ-dependent sugar dehydrogenase [Chloroflexi bacterium]|nr:PQQ-dependent sugar dehydrogenase [Chloroflexota bacterium]
MACKSEAKADPPSDRNYVLTPVVTEGLIRPLFVTAAPDDPSRLFIVDQPGEIYIAQEGTLLETPFLDISPIANDNGNEQGLLGLAFHPDYAENGYFFVNYTAQDGSTVVARYSVSADDPNVADPDSEKIVIWIDQPFPNHNGGMLAFGPDGYLYIGMGDGGGAGDPNNNGQDRFTLLGAMLRLDINTEPYAIPPDNPFVDGTQGRPEVWANGLRNPWRFSFDRATGDLYIGDVGQNQYEEVDFQPADSTGGENYGWNIYEGFHSYEGQELAGTVQPIAEYSHDLGCSISGGYVYRGSELPELDGVYLYGDYCTGTIWWLKNTDGKWDGDVFMNTGFQISSFGQDANGEVYVVDQAGQILKLEVEK